MEVHVRCHEILPVQKVKTASYKNFLQGYPQRVSFICLVIGVFIGTQTFSVPTSSHKTLSSGWVRSAYYSRWREERDRKKKCCIFSIKRLPSGETTCNHFFFSALQMVCMFAVYVEVCASCSIHIHRNWLLILNAILLWGTDLMYRNIYGMSSPSLGLQDPWIHSVFSVVEPLIIDELWIERINQIRLDKTIQDHTRPQTLHGLPKLPTDGPSTTWKDSPTHPTGTFLSSS